MSIVEYLFHIYILVYQPGRPFCLIGVVLPR